MKKTKLFIELVLYFNSDVDMDEIAKKIPIIPTDLKNKKDRNKYPNSNDNLEGFLSFNTGYLESVVLEDVSLKLIGMILPAIEEIQMVLKKYSGQARIDVVVEVGKNTPSLYFGRDLLLIIEKLEADIDVDMYIL